MKEIDPISTQEFLDLELTDEMTPEQAEWLISISRFVELEDGEHLASDGDKIEHAYIILSGILEVFNQVGGQFLLLARYERGGVSGSLPYSRMTHANGMARVEGPTQVMMVPKSCFPEMAQRAPSLIQRLVEIMLDRIRSSTRTEQQREKMVSLGKISAGFAHELNNPASAMHRAASSLGETFYKVMGVLRDLASQSIPADAWATVQSILNEDRGADSDLSLLERSDQEDVLEDLFQEWDIEDSYALAGELVEHGIEAEDIEELADGLPDESKESMIRLLTHLVTLKSMIGEVKTASSKISDLIDSVKSYSHMDRSPDKEVADLEEGLNHTLTILSTRLKEKDIRLELDYEKGLPHMKVYVSELNQLWTNLIDNAIDAMEEGGTLTISTADRDKNVQVCIKDTGHGIPPEIQSKIFDPFFSTKNTNAQGLGLDIAQRIARLHRGDITLKSKKGDTCFTVCLPKEA